MKKLKTFVALLLAFALLSALVLPDGRMTRAEEADFSGYIDKEETVYASLKADGSLDTLTVVSLLNRGAKNDSLYFEDRADFFEDSITPLTSGVKLVTRGKKIIFEADEDITSMHYRGTPINRELPFIIKIKYCIDGNQLLPEQLAGRSGDFEMEISVKSNPDAKKYYRDNYIGQIQIPMSLNVFGSIKAAGSQSVLAGTTLTLSYTVLPGSDKDIKITAKASLFELGQISIACIPFDLAMFQDGSMDFEKEDLDKMVEGSTILSDGTRQMAEGFRELSDAIKLLGDGSEDLVDGYDELTDGYGDFLSGLDELGKGMSELSDGLSKLDDGGQELYEGFVEMRSQITLFLDELSTTLSFLDFMMGLMEQGDMAGGDLVGRLEDVRDQLSEYLDDTGLTVLNLIIEMLKNMPESDEDQIKASEAAVLIKAGMKDFEDGLKEYTDGVSRLSDGSKELSGGFGLIQDGGKQLKGGFGEFGQGLSEFSDGTKKMQTGTKKLSTAMNALATGQADFAKGLSDSVGLFDDFIKDSDDDSDPVSFNKDGVTVNSVQFVISSQQISLDKEEAPPKEPVKKRSFWQKIVDMVTGIFKK